VPQPRVLPDTSFGKYSLVAKIAKGGMAEILLAKLTGTAGFEKLVCIKRILPDLIEDQQFVSMFLAEARIAALISHQNVCQVFELGEIDGSYYIAMEYLEGVPVAMLRHTAQYGQPPDPRLVVGIGVQACDGLHHAHELSRPDGAPLELVHRDVSGQNLFVTSSGVVKVLDFGIAKVQDATTRTTTGAVKGTYAYMAPEQLRGGAIDRRVDVFATGIVLWETLAQRSLFKRDNDYLTFQAITTDPIPDIATLRPDVPPALSAAIATALSRDPARRFASARELGEALAAAVPPLPVSRIADEIARAFAPQLREQRALARLAHRGEDALSHEPSAALDESAMTTPASGKRLPTPLPVTAPTPRSQTQSIPPAPRSTLPRAYVIGGTAAAVCALAAVAYVLWPRPAAGPVAPAPATSEHAVVAAPPAGSSRSAPAPVVDAVMVAPASVVDAGAIQVTTTEIGSNEVPVAPKPVPRIHAKPAVHERPGFLSIDSEPVYAEIFIDGKSYGETPLLRVELAPGRHVVRAVSPSRTAQQQRVDIESGQVTVRRLEW